MCAHHPDEPVDVLLIDDHSTVRRGLAQLLDAQEDMRVVGEAQGGREGIELVREQRPEVVLMDVSMPGMSGVEATRKIKAEMPEIRVIGLSMHDLDGTRESMLRAGADAYLTKDSDPEDLMATIREAGG